MPLLSSAEQAERTKTTLEKFERAELAAQNPRLLLVDSPTIQARNNIAAELLSFYTFLTDMYLPAESLKHPPQGGWPYVNAERFAFLGKSDAVIDLYKHIPYISQDEKDSYHIDIRCVCLDYTGSYFERKVVKRQDGDQDPPIFEDMEEPAWHRLKEPQHIAILAEPSSPLHGWYIALDTRDGKAARIRPMDEQYNRLSFEYDDLEGLFSGIKRRLRALDMVPVSPFEIINPADYHRDDYATCNKIKGLYYKHGWLSPDFRKDACMLEVEQTWKEHQQTQEERLQRRTS